jgi:hypothetical protein
MSKDTKSQTAAAQMMIDDEPDDWYVHAALAGRNVVTDECTGIRGSSAQAARVRRVVPIARLG